MSVLDYVKGHQEQRDKLSQEVRAKTAGPVLESLEENFHMVRLVPPQARFFVT